MDHLKVKLNVPVIILTLILTSNCIAQQDKILRFEFGSGHTVPNHIAIDSTTIYSPTQHYGFDYDSKVQIIHRNKGNDIEHEFCTSAQSFFFSVKLPEGNP